ncbi:hypothetical protein GO009_09970 [Muricauda sp. TY007]|nr:hypothetical protein [Muricauda sp. TY007]
MPTNSPSKIARTIKSGTAREIFLLRFRFWDSVFYNDTVGRHSNEKVIAAYVKN